MGGAAERWNNASSNRPPAGTAGTPAQAERHSASHKTQKRFMGVSRAHRGAPRDYLTLLSRAMQPGIADRHLAGPASLHLVEQRVRGFGHFQAARAGLGLFVDLDRNRTCLHGLEQARTQVDEPSLGASCTSRSSCSTARRITGTGISRLIAREPKRPMVCSTKVRWRISWRVSGCWRSRRCKSAWPRRSASPAEVPLVLAPWRSSASPSTTCTLAPRTSSFSGRLSSSRTRLKGDEDSGLRDGMGRSTMGYLRACHGTLPEASGRGSRFHEILPNARPAMKLLPLSLALTLAAASLSLPVRAGSVEVRYDSREPHSDAGSTPAEREKNLAAVAAAARARPASLPAAQTLEVELLDLDLTGTVRLSRHPLGELRVVTGRADGPRIRLRYTLREGGSTLASGEEALYDAALPRPAARATAPAVTRCVTKERCSIIGSFSDSPRRSKRSQSFREA
ncbi:DUF3016 domain-containing protein [Piscinibacter aquaticus]|uniref:DUF3016 domain-containing protein n=1 Tax=Piscinibacter aquaticus TaxID=392597 RepID=A0A5C6U0W8_9BURK|nr:DUF3016 domain-containing protein [Piscinibacter aquaticus]